MTVNERQRRLEIIKENNVKRPEAETVTFKECLEYFEKIQNFFVTEKIDYDLTDIDHIIMELREILEI